MSRRAPAVDTACPASAAMSGRTGLPVAFAGGRSGSARVCATPRAIQSAKCASRRLARAEDRILLVQDDGGLTAHHAGRPALAAPTGNRRSRSAPPVAAVPARAGLRPVPRASATTALVPRNSPAPGDPGPRQHENLAPPRTPPTARRRCAPSVISATRCPRRTNSLASASAGKKCPPVPPAAITIGRTGSPLIVHPPTTRCGPRCRVKASSIPIPSAIASTGRSAIRDEWQRHPLGRDQMPAMKPC